MYGYHAWIVLAETTEEADVGGLERKKAELRRLLTDQTSCRPRDPIAEVNGETVLQCSCSRNHRGDEHGRLMTVLEWISVQLPGSHGLVYWYDDEVPGRHAFDGYRVIVVARGALLERFDPFLSPICPVVED